MKYYIGFAKDQPFSTESFKKMQSLADILRQLGRNFVENKECIVKNHFCAIKFERKNKNITKGSPDMSRYPPKVLKIANKGQSVGAI